MANPHASQNFYPFVPPNQTMYNQQNMYNQMMPMMPVMFYPVQQQSQIHSLFIGDLDKGITDEMLFQAFQQYGTINSVRIMKDKERNSRGFGYVNYYNQNHAIKAQNEMDQKVILKKPIRVEYKVDFNQVDKSGKLYLKISDKALRMKQIKPFFNEFGEIMASKIETDNQGKSLGYGYIQFKDAKSIQSFFAKHKNGKISIYDSEIFASQDKNEANLHIKGFPDSADESKLFQEIEDYFKRFGTIMSMKVSKNDYHNKYFALIRYNDVESAEDAIEAIEKLKANPFGGDAPLEANLEQNQAVRKRILETKYLSIYERSISIQDLKENVTQEMLKEKFMSFGKVENVRITKKETKTYAQITFSNENENIKALQNWRFLNLGQFFNNYDPSKNYIRKAQSNLLNSRLNSRYTNLEHLQKNDSIFQRIDDIKTHFEEYSKRSKEEQQAILDRIVYQMIVKYCKEKNVDDLVIGQVSNILSDLEILELDEIIEFCKDKTQLQAQIEEAIEIANEREYAGKKKKKDNKIKSDLI